MMCQRQHVVSLFPCGSIQNAAAHARAIGAEGTPTHGLECAADDVLAPIKIGNTQDRDVVLQERRIEALDAGIDRGRPELETYRGLVAQIEEHMQQQQLVLAALNTEKKAVTRA